MYQYAWNNPVSALDPLGLKTLVITVGIGGQIGYDRWLGAIPGMIQLSTGGGIDFGVAVSYGPSLGDWSIGGVKLVTKTTACVGASTGAGVHIEIDQAGNVSELNGTATSTTASGGLGPFAGVSLGDDNSVGVDLERLGVGAGASAITETTTTTVKPW